jgi:olefin beta-lactone synthetase
MSIIELLRQVVGMRPNQAAIVASRRGVDRAVSFAELSRAAESGAAYLISLGLRPGDAVLVLQPMSIELYEVLLSVFRAGLVAMFLDPSAGPDHLEQCIAMQPPAAFIGSSKAHLLLFRSKALRQIPRRIVTGRWFPGSRAWFRHRQSEPATHLDLPAAESPALLTFTSGSTGHPKAAVRTHQFLIAQHRALRTSIDLEAGEVDLSTLPIFVLANLASGLTSVIPDADLRFPGRIDPIPVLAQIQRLQTTRVAGSPAFFERLADACEAEGLVLSELRKLYTGGAPVFPRLLRRLQRLAPHATVSAVYGSTEAEPIAHIAQEQVLDEDYKAMNHGGGLLVGHTVPEVDLRIVEECWGTPLGALTRNGFEERFVGQGEIGEIVVTGEHVLKSYFRDVGNQETKFDVAGTVWHRTGDMGCLDAAGRLWLMGRCNARIKDARGVLDPFTVECIAQEDASIARSACVSHCGRRLLLVELLNAGKGPASDLVERLRWAQIDEIRVVAKIPVDKRHNAKIDYPGLLKSLDS